MTNKDLKVGEKKTFTIKTVVDDKGITFTPEGDVLIIQGVMYGEENVYAEIVEIHEKTILAKKILSNSNPPPPNTNNGYDLDDAHEEDYDEEEPPEEEGEEGG